MCDPDFDYTLMIEYEKLGILDLRGILKMLQHCPSYCDIEVELLADEVISRMNKCEYSLRDNSELVKLIFETFEMLKKISKHMAPDQKRRVSEKLVLIHTNYNKFMYDNPSPIASPVVSPISESPSQDHFTTQVKAPKIMKKAKRMHR